MTSLKRICLVAVLVGFLLHGSGYCAAGQTDVVLTHLRCEYRENPLGIDVRQPRLSWILDSSQRGQKQTAYRILVASTEEKLANDLGDLWDSGKVESNQSTQIVYQGQELKSRMHCLWKVCVWDKDDIKTGFSEPAYWTMGLLSDSDWRGSWIGMNIPDSTVNADESLDGPPPPWFRKTFSVSKPVKRAFVYITARGLFELHINGERIGKDVFSPGWTDYHKRIQYCTYEVTSQLRGGMNAVGAIIGDGWYSGYIGEQLERGYYGLQNSMLLQLEVEYTDGTMDVFATDGTWRCSDGPLLSSDIIMGEYYDARKEMPGWDTADFNDSSWQSVVLLENPSATLVAHCSEPVQVTEYLNPVAIYEPVKGVYVINFGQNIAGWARLTVKGEAGRKVILRFAERLYHDGSIYTANLRGARATDTYVLKGGKEEVWEPRFTYHGFQYVEVSGLPGAPDLSTVTGCVAHSTTLPAGHFECSDSMVNQLWRNITWTQRANFFSIPTGCPQRDERLGFLGDTQLFMSTASFNMNVAAFFTKWMDDIEDAQSSEGAFTVIAPNLTGIEIFNGYPGWADAGVIIAWKMYREYGDTRIIEKYYDAMVRWMDFLQKEDSDMICGNKEETANADWLSVIANTPACLVRMAYWAYDASLMSRMARVIGHNQDAQEYEQLFASVKSAFQENFVLPDGRITCNTQTGCLLALAMDLMPTGAHEAAVKQLVENIRQRDWHLSTGFIGVGLLNPVLTQWGYPDVAYRLLLNDTYPSWGYSIKNGATTIWERWDGWSQDKGFHDSDMNSFNHYAFGAIGEWLYRHVAGIQLDAEVPGYKHIIIKPSPGCDLTYAHAEYHSIHGKIASGWRKDGNRIALDVTVPANTTATVFIPSEREALITESGLPAGEAEGVTLLGYENGCTGFSVESGHYSFSTIVPPTFAIRGIVRGEIVSDVPIILSGDASHIAHTEADGSYAFNNLDGCGHYLITPSLEGYDFYPPDCEILGLVGDVSHCDFVVRQSPLCVVERIYGENAEETQFLRSFRDSVLTATEEGREIIRVYYELSPLLSDAIQEDGTCATMVREAIHEILLLMRHDNGRM